MRPFLIAMLFGGLGFGVGACASSDAEPANVTPTAEVGSTTPTPAPSAPAPKEQPKEDPAPPKKKNECKLQAMTDVATVTPSFVVYSLPNEIPTPMTGGTLAGQYAVDGAKVYLPSGAAGLVDVEQSTGTIDAWSVFEGTNYRLHLKADFTLASVQGPLSQGVDTESQGGFTTNAEVLLLDHECDGAISDEADYSFTDTGGGRATILIKTPTPYGDTYLQLDATKM